MIIIIIIIINLTAGLGPRNTKGGHAPELPRGDGTPAGAAYY